eukprot:SAG11_NODE_13243_length_663_cov_1.274823_1_plen_86_part_10
MAIATAILTGLAVNAISKAVGLGYGGLIEKDGMYELHKGEIVIPAKEAQKLLSEYKKAMSKAGVSSGSALAKAAKEGKKEIPKSQQ